MANEVSNSVLTSDFFSLRYGPYYYYTKTLEGQQYKIHCRRKIPANAGPASEKDVMDQTLPEEILL